MDVIFDSVNNSYNRKLEIFFSLFNECFPMIKIKLKPQKHFRPWITLGIRKSPPLKKTKLYEKYLISRTTKNEAEYKT